MNSDKFFRMLGLCARAGMLVSGQDAVRIAVRKGSAHLVIADEQASENTKKGLSALCAHRTQLIYVRGDLGHWIGKPGRMMAAVTDRRFASTLLDHYTYSMQDEH